MSQTLDLLREDHRNFERLLAMLEQEIEVFRIAEEPDYSLLEAMISYFLAYPETIHHPVEDQVMRRLRHRNSDAAASVGDLEAEHEMESRRIQALWATIQKILADQEIPREVLITAAESFILHLRGHMEMEEARFFTAAETYLTEEDWAELDAALTDAHDPVFRGDGASDLASLRDQILEWHRSQQS